MIISRLLRWFLAGGGSSSGFWFPELGICLNPLVRRVAHARIKREQVRLARLNRCRRQRRKLLHALFTHHRFKVFARREVFVNLLCRLHRVEDDVGRVWKSIDRRISRPVCVGNFLVRGGYQLHDFVPILVMSLLNLEARDFEIAHVSYVHLGTQAVILAECQCGGVGLAQKFTVGGSGAVKGSRQRFILLSCERILFPRGKRIVAGQKERTRLTRKRFHSQVVGWPFRLLHGLNKHAFGLFMCHTRLSRFRILPEDRQYFGWHISSGLVLAQSNPGYS